MKELKINIPKGYEIDKENSTFECIKFRPIIKRWRDDENRLIAGYFIMPNGISKQYSNYNNKWNHNLFATKEQAKSALAMAQISQIMANDKRFGGVITDEEWENRYEIKWVIERQELNINRTAYHITYKFLAFHTPEQRDLFLEENEDLVKDYLMVP